MQIKGIFPALVTPFDSSGAVALSNLKHNIGLYNQTAVAGYVALGSTGESVMLSREEADSVLAAVLEFTAAEKTPDCWHRSRVHGRDHCQNQARGRSRLSSGAGKNSLLLQAGLSRRDVSSSLSRGCRCIAHSDPALLRTALHGSQPGNAGDSSVSRTSQHRRYQRQFRSSPTVGRSHRRSTIQFSGTHRRRRGNLLSTRPRCTWCDPCPGERTSREMRGTFRSFSKLTSMIAPGNYN